MKKIMKFAALTFCAMFFCVFSFHTALANSTEVIKNGDIENGRLRPGIQVIHLYLQPVALPGAQQKMNGQSKFSIAGISF